MDAAAPYFYCKRGVDCPMKLTIKFEQVDPIAKEDSSIALKNASAFSTPKDLQKELQYVSVRKFATLEHNYSILDGSMQDFPSNTASYQFGLWSASASNNSGVLSPIPTLTATFSKFHKSAGITLYFYPFSTDFASRVRVTWYSNAVVLHRGEYALHGVESSVAQAVSDWNKITVEFLETNNPYRFIKLMGIDYGIIREFSDEEINTASVLEEFNPISDNISINTANFQIKTHSPEFSHISGNMEDDMLMRNQRLHITADGLPFGTYFLQDWKDSNTIGNTFEFEAYDAIGAIDRHEFMGGIYENKLAADIIKEIWAICFPTMVIGYTIDANLLPSRVSGFIPICTCREALQSVAFAIGAAVNSTRKGFVWIYGRDTTDVAHEAVVTASDKEPFSNVSLLTEDKDTLNIANIATLEQNQSLLDGSQVTFPDDVKKYDFPLWTKASSDSTGKFSVPPTVDATLDGYHSSKEIYLYFYPFTDDYASRVRATWYDSYNNVLQMGEYDFNSVVGVIRQPVTNYRRVKIEFLTTNTPFRRVKLWNIDFSLGDRIKLDRIYSGSGFTQRAEYYSGLALTAYSYVKGTETVEAFKGIAAAGTHEIRFSEPLHSLRITGATIQNYGHNHAIVQVANTQEIVLTGSRYIESKTMYNITQPVAAGETANVVTFENAKLVTPATVAKRAADLWEYVSQTTVIERNIRLDSVECGMISRMDTTKRPIVGTVESLNINLRGNRAVAKIYGNVDTTSNG